MIAIASGLLGNVETATATAVKKDAGSGGFAAAFEEVSAKDAGTVAQARRGNGGGNRGGQTGIVGGRSGRTAVLAAKAAVAKAAGDVALEGNAVEAGGAVDAGVAGKIESSGANAGKPTLTADADASDFVESEIARRDVTGGPLPVDEGASSGAAKGPQNAGSTLAVALRGGESLQGSAANAAPVVKDNGWVAQVGRAATSQNKGAGRVDVGALQTQSADVSVAVEGVSAKVVVGAVPDAVATGGSIAGNIRLLGPGAQLEDAAGVSGTTGTKESEPAAHVASTALGQTARVARDSRSVAAAKVQGVSSGDQTSIVKPGLQQAGGTVQVQPTDVTATSAVWVAGQDVSGVTGQQGAKVTPVAGAERGLTHQITVASEGTDGATGQGLGSWQSSASGNASVAARSTAGPQKIVPQQVIAPSFVSSSVIVQQANGQPTIVQTAGAQKAAAVPQGAVGAAAEDASNVARVFGGPVAGAGQVASQRVKPEAVGSQQAGAQQLQSGPVGSQRIKTSIVGAQQVEAESLSSAESGIVEQQSDLSLSGAAETVQRTGGPVVAGTTADKDKHAPSVAATASSSGKRVAATGSNRSSVTNAGAASTAANASVPSASLSVPSVSASPAASSAEVTKNATGDADAANANIAAAPVRRVSASPLTAGTLIDKTDTTGPVQGVDPALEGTETPGQTAISESSSTTGVLGQAQESAGRVAAAAIASVAALQVGRVAAGGAAVSGTAGARERRAPGTEGKTAERTSAETSSLAQPITLQHPAGPVPEAAKASSGSHPSSSDEGSQSLSAGAAGLGGGGGVVPLSTSQVATHGVVAPSITATTTADGTVQSPTLTNGTGVLASTGVAGTDSFVSPVAHTTLQATPTVLEVGVPGGTHGWLKIRAEIGEGGTVQASMSAATHEGQETLRRELPAMNAFLDSEHVPVSVQVAAHGVSSAGASSVTGGDTGFNPGSGLSQDAGSAQREAQTALPNGGDGARQSSGDGSQDSSRATAGNGASARAAVSAESDWLRSSNADPGSGYGSGISANGGGWLNVMA